MNEKTTQQPLVVVSDLNNELGLTRIIMQHDTEQDCWSTKLEFEKPYSLHLKITAHARSKDDVILEVKNKILLLTKLLQDLERLEFSNSVNQYYWHENSCRAMDAHSGNCNCWHDEGNGVYPDALFENGETWPNTKDFTWRVKVKT